MIMSLLSLRLMFCHLSHRSLISLFHLYCLGHLYKYITKKCTPEYPHILFSRNIRLIIRIWHLPRLFMPIIIQVNLYQSIQLLEFLVIALLDPYLELLLVLVRGLVADFGFWVLVVSQSRAGFVDWDAVVLCTGKGLWNDFGWFVVLYSMVYGQVSTFLFINRTCIATRISSGCAATTSSPGLLSSHSFLFNQRVPQTSANTSSPPTWAVSISFRSFPIVRLGITSVAARFVCVFGLMTQLFVKITITPSSRYVIWFWVSFINWYMVAFCCRVSICDNNKKNALSTHLIQFCSVLAASSTIWVRLSRQSSGKMSYADLNSFIN